MFRLGASELAGIFKHLSCTEEEATLWSAGRQAAVCLNVGYLPGRTAVPVGAAALGQHPDLHR